MKVKTTKKKVLHLAPDPCEDCTTQDVTCATPFCTAPIEGTLGANLVAVIDNVESEEQGPIV